MNSGRYIDKDGRLHGDINKDTGMGYYIDWNNYRFEVNETSESSAIITIYVVDDSCRQGGNNYRSKNAEGKRSMAIRKDVLLTPNSYWQL